MFTKWNDDYATGITWIDDQHKMMVVLINNLYESITNNNYKQSVQILDELLDFANIHFSTEEWFFKKYNYALRFDHIKEHKAILNKLSDFKNDYKPLPVSKRKYICHNAGSERRDGCIRFDTAFGARQLSCYGTRCGPTGNK